MSYKILITGAAGFIGSHLAQRLIKDKRVEQIIGVDNLSGYPNLKNARLNSLNQTNSPKWQFVLADIANRELVENIFSTFAPNIVVHLAAKPGIQHCEQFPASALQANIVGFFNVLNCCRVYDVQHLIFASSSTANTTGDCADYSTLSFYSATKITNELFAFSFSQNHDLTSTALRFFNVYGKFGRPDALYLKLACRLAKNVPLNLYGYGMLTRDFTFIDDVVEGILRVIFHKPRKIFNLYDLGRGKPIPILKFCDVLIKKFCAAQIFKKDFPHYKNLLKLAPQRPFDRLSNCADGSAFKRDFDFAPKTDISEGLNSVVANFPAIKELI